MGLLGNIIAKGVMTAARNSTIKAVGDVAVNVIATKTSNSVEKEDVIEKNGVILIKPTRSSESYCGENALEIAKELLGIGFESVTLKPVNTLNERNRKRYGEIQSVSINGKEEFLGRKKVPASSYIIIEYYDFKKNVDLEVYKGVVKIIPGIMKRNSEQENNEASSSLKKFCPYCGIKMTIAGAKFCTNCGRRIE